MPDVTLQVKCPQSHVFCLLVDRRKSQAVLTDAFSLYPLVSPDVGDEAPGLGHTKQMPLPLCGPTQHLNNLYVVHFLAYCWNCSKLFWDKRNFFLSFFLFLPCRPKSWIEEQEMGSFLSVAKGSEEPPVFLEIHYTGSPNASEAPLVFVGKGITFDRYFLGVSVLTILVNAMCI